MTFYTFQSVKALTASCFLLCPACRDDKNSHLFLHVYVSSLQAHVNELGELLLNITNPTSIIFISKTRIYKTPLINVNISDYTFVHLPLPTKAGGVGAYVSRSMKFSENESLR